jgi:hypothetical protein
MDCQTARLLLDLGRNCGPDDTAALDAHLSECGGCQGFAAAQAGFDAAIAAAMRTVPLPAGGAERMVRLATGRHSAVVRGRWLKTGAGLAAVALLATLGVVGFYRTRPRLDTAQVAQAFDYRRDDPERYATDWLRANGLPPALPHPVNYQFFLDANRSDLDGKPTPCLHFVRGGDTLRVYVLSRGQFRLTDLRPAQSSFATVQPVPESPAHPGVAYLLVYTSPTLDTFLRPDDPVQ